MTYEKFKIKSKELDETITDSAISKFIKQLLILFFIESSALATIAFICTRQSYAAVLLTYVVSLLMASSILDYMVTDKDIFHETKKLIFKVGIPLCVLLVLGAIGVYFLV